MLQNHLNSRNRLLLIGLICCVSFFAVARVLAETAVTTNDTAVVTGQSNNDFVATHYLGCTFPITVINEPELNAAISCYNTLTNPGIYIITLTENISLTNATMQISNAVSGVNLTVEGGGFIIDGQDISDVRPFHIQTDTTVTLQNITIRGGNVDGDGGAIINDNGNLTLQNGTVMFNAASGSGGGIFNLGTLTVNNSTIYSNTAFWFGGGIANFSTLTVTHTTVNQNETTAADGGGLYSVGNVTVWVSQSTFSNNSIGESGGGISVHDGVDLTIDNSTFSGNENRQGEPGGGLYNKNSFVTINNSTFHGNSDGIATGVDLCFTADMQVLLADGTTKRIADVVHGDELLSYDFERQQETSSRVEHTLQRPVNEFLRLNDLEVTAEHPFAVGENEWRTAAELQIGDRVLSDNGWTTIQSKTKIVKEVEVFNLSVDGPHNYYVFDGRNTYLAHNKNIQAGAGDVTINNSIITNHNGVDCISDGEGQFLGSNNLIDAHNAGACSSVSSAAVTNFDKTLKNNGGATRTHAVLPGSNALEAGFGCLATDQRGVPRPQNTTCDIGAYELWQLSITAVSTTDAELAWGTVDSGCTYDVFEATNPYFTPTEPAEYPNATSVHPINGRLGNPAINYFFINRATCDGILTAYSNEVGEFDFEIIPGN